MRAFPPPAVLHGALAALGLSAGCVDADPRLPPETRTVAVGEPSSAPAAFRRYGCPECHTIPGVAGADALVGPPLTGFAGRRFIAGRLPNVPEELVRWIVDPQGVKPGTAMPSMGVAEADARHMAAYLYTLR